MKASANSFYPKPIFLERVLKCGNIPSKLFIYIIVFKTTNLRIIWLFCSSDIWCNRLMYLEWTLLTPEYKWITIMNGYFMTISGHCFSNCIFIFHKMQICTYFYFRFFAILYIHTEKVCINSKYWFAVFASLRFV